MSAVLSSAPAQPSFSKLPSPCATCPCSTTGCPSKALSTSSSASTKVQQEGGRGRAQSWSMWEQKELEREIMNSWEWQS